MPRRTRSAPEMSASASGRKLVMTLPEPPSANRWWRKWRNRMVLSPEARQYKAFALVRVIAATGLHASRFPLFPTAPIRVTVTWYRGRKSGDLDKRLGVVLDALQGIGYRNDGQIVDLVAERIDRPGDPGLTVTVEEA